jgi:hypothetical protein
LNVTPDYKSLAPAKICTKYTLPDFDLMLTNFIHHSSLASSKYTCWDLKYGHFQVWNKFQLQLHSAFQPQVIMPSRVVQVYPPSKDFPLSNCNTILVNDPGIGGNISMFIPNLWALLILYIASYVAQVQLIFQPTIQWGLDLELPSYFSNLLLHVQYFHFTSCPEDHPELMMWSMEHTYTHDEDGNNHRQGAVVWITDAMHTVRLIPDFGEAVDKSMSSATYLVLQTRRVIMHLVLSLYRQ